MDYTVFIPFKLHRKNVTRIRIHNTDSHKFLIHFKKDGKLYRKVITATGATPTNKKENAVAQLEDFYNQAGRSYVPMNIRLDDY